MSGSVQCCKPTKSEIGLWGEDLAAEHLKRSGYVILGRRVRPDLHDEIDIIAQKKDILVFVEVKTRVSEAFGRPAAAVGRAKRKALCRAAASYLRRVKYPLSVYRFDVIEVVGNPDKPKSPVIRHIEDAFRFPVRYRFSREREKSKIIDFNRFFSQLIRLARLVSFAFKLSRRK